MIISDEADPDLVSGRTGDPEQIHVRSADDVRKRGT